MASPPQPVPSPGALGHQPGRSPLLPPGGGFGESSCQWAGEPHPPPGACSSDWDQARHPSPDMAATPHPDPSASPRRTRPVSDAGPAAPHPNMLAASLGWLLCRGPASPGPLDTRFRPADPALSHPDTGSQWLRGPSPPGLPAISRSQGRAYSLRVARAGARTASSSLTRTAPSPVPSRPVSTHGPRHSASKNPGAGGPWHKSPSLWNLACPGPGLRAGGPPPRRRQTLLPPAQQG